MVRINLLPSEILERRRFEVFYPYIFIAGSIALGLVVVTWLGMQFFAAQRATEVQQSQEVVQKMSEQANMLKVFEEQRTALASRQSIATQALAGRLDMGRIMEEISLVLPDPMWLNSLALEQDVGADLKGGVPNINEAKLSDGYKSIAWGMVRLNSLDSLYDVWLTSAAGTTPTVGFEITAKIADTNASAATSSSVPPTASAQ